MAANSNTALEVEIFGSVYHVRGQQGQEHLEELAALVDRKMREIGDRVTTVDTGKIAILAALNLADELLQRTKQQEGERAQIMEKAARLTEELSQALYSSRDGEPQGA
jgi:cell division protein ZapA